MFNFFVFPADFDGLFCSVASSPGPPHPPSDPPLPPNYPPNLENGHFLGLGGNLGVGGGRRGGGGVLVRKLPNRKGPQMGLNMYIFARLYELTQIVSFLLGTFLIL